MLRLEPVAVTLTSSLPSSTRKRFWMSAANADKVGASGAGMMVRTLSPILTVNDLKSVTCGRVPNLTPVIPLPDAVGTPTSAPVSRRIVAVCDKVGAVILRLKLDDWNCRPEVPLTVTDNSSVPSSARNCFCRSAASAFKSALAGEGFRLNCLPATMIENALKSVTDGELPKLILDSEAMNVAAGGTDWVPVAASFTLASAVRDIAEMRFDKSDELKTRLPLSTLTETVASVVRIWFCRSVANAVRLAAPGVGVKLIGLPSIVIEKLLKSVTWGLDALKAGASSFAVAVDGLAVVPVATPALFEPSVRLNGKPPLTGVVDAA